ncbi:MAG: hypothetical protein ACRDCC_07665 [Culicoidibacterales bacterium]
MLNQIDTNCQMIENLLLEYSDNQIPELEKFFELIRKKNVYERTHLMLLILSESGILKEITKKRKILENLATEEVTNPSFWIEYL